MRRQAKEQETFIPSGGFIAATASRALHSVFQARLSTLRSLSLSYETSWAKAKDYAVAISSSLTLSSSSILVTNPLSFAFSNYTFELTLFLLSVQTIQPARAIMIAITPHWDRAGTVGGGSTTTLFVQHFSARGEHSSDSTQEQNFQVELGEDFLGNGDLMLVSDLYYGILFLLNNVNW